MQRATIVGMVVFMVLGCGGMVDMAKERAEKEVAEQVVGLALGGDVNVNDDGTVTLETDGMKLQAGGTQKVPDEFPIKPPAAFTVGGVTVMDNDGRHQVMLITNTTTPMSELPTVAEEVVAAAKAAGWTETSKSTTMANEGSMFVFSAEKGEEKLAVQITQGADGGAGVWSWDRPQ